MNDNANAAARAAPRRRHVAMCPFPFSSHPGTFFLLSHKITAADPEAHVSFFTTESSAAELAASTSTKGGNVRIRCIPSGAAAGKTVHPLEVIGKFMEAVGKGLREGMAAAEVEVGAEISCLVADAFLSDVCREIAEEKAVKWVALWVSSAVSMAAHLYTDELRSRIGSVEGIEAHKDETLDQYIPGFPPVPIIDLPSEILLADLSSPVARVLHLMSRNLPKAAAVVMNSFHPLESAVTATLNAAFGNKFLSGGPYSLTLSSATLGAQDKYGCLPWLDTHLVVPASVLYISFGTVRTPEPEEFTGLAEALEEVGLPFLWALPDRFRAQLPEGFVERTARSGKAKVVPWAPQMTVLRHAAVGAQLTHCGWNSAMESIMMGVPMICRGFAAADNMMNSRLVEGVWGIGLEVEGRRMTRRAVARAVDRVLMGEEGRRMREKIREMKGLVEEAAAEPHGSSYKDLQKFINIIIS